MFAPSQVETPHTCPRCKVILPPNEVTCYSCGFQLNHMRLKDTPRLAQVSLPSNKLKDEGRKHRYGIVMYFISIFLAIFLFAFLFLRAAGIPISALFPFLAVTHANTAYSTPAGTPIFSDDFLSDVNGWNLRSSPGMYAVTLNQGKMAMEINQHKLLWELLPGESTYSDFIFSVNAVLSQGDQNNGYGVYIRGSANQSSDLATYYRFEIYGDGSYAIFKGTLAPNGYTLDSTIVDYTIGQSIQPHGKLNHVMIVAKGAALSFIVNGQLLKTIKDPSYKSGTLALFVSNLPQSTTGAQVQFSNLAIYPV